MIVRYGASMEMKKKNYIAQLRYYTNCRTTIPVQAYTPEEAKEKAIEQFKRWNDGEPKHLLDIEIKP